MGIAQGMLTVLRTHGSTRHTDTFACLTQLYGTTSCTHARDSSAQIQISRFPCGYLQPAFRRDAKSSFILQKGPLNREYLFLRAWLEVGEVSFERYREEVLPTIT